MNDICRAFQSQARRTSRLLAAGARAGVRLAEETLTNLLILRLALEQSSEFDIRGYSKTEEAILGADWEMWIGGRLGSWLPCRIQAKVLNPDTAAFDHLHYRKHAASPYQCDALIHEARKAVPRRVPLYVLYTHTRFMTRDRGSTWPCGSYSRRSDLFGCSLVHAEHVRSLRSKGLKRQLVEVLPVMRPWHCLVCCGGFGGADLAQSALAWLLATVSRTGDADVLRARGASADDVGASNLGELSREIPQYVRTMLDGGEPELPPDLGGLLLVRERTPAA